MPVAPRLEWPSGFSVSDMLTAAGRVETELNANGDPKYRGYAPRADSRTDAEGWLVEYYIYDGSNKLLTVHRMAGIAWNERTAILANVHLKDISPAKGSVKVLGVASAVQHKRGEVVPGSVSIASTAFVAHTMVVTARAFGTMALVVKGSRATPNAYARVFGQVSVASTVKPAFAMVLATVSVAAYVRSGSAKGGFAVGSVKALGKVVATKVSS